MKKILILFIAIPILSFAQDKKEMKVITKAMRDITSEVDKYEGSKSWDSPFYGKGIAGTTPKRVRLMKVKKKDGSITTYMSLLAFGSTLNIDGTGFVLLFQDGTRLENKEIKVDYKSDTGTAYWKYSIFTRLTDEELEMFATKKIDSYKLYIYEGKPITKKSTLQVMGYAKALMTVK